MTATHRRSFWLRVGAPLAGCLAALALCRLSAPAEDAAPPPVAAARQADADRPAAASYLGTEASCARCHRGPTEGDKQNGVLDRIALDEYQIWHGDKPDRAGGPYKDVHHNAHKVLTEGPRVATMEKLLGITAASDARCLSCHAVNCQQNEPDAALIVKEGVGCEACHGGSSRWMDAHWKRARLFENGPTWRELSAGEKESKWGMNDVWSPVKRTQLCLSCHLGNSREGKIVTHEMYAAGHPPLPAFEIETFATRMPRHRKPLSDKSAAAYDYRPDQSYAARMVLVGGLVGLRETIRLFHEEAEQMRGWPRQTLQATNYSTGGWPELALYDCAACHHDLQLPSWRQQRGLGGVPGRPKYRAWPLALARLALVTDGKDNAALAATLDPLRQALERRPFGERADVSAAARSVIEQLDGSLERLAGQTYDARMSLRLLQSICRIGMADAPDFDSARQLACAFQAVYQELDPKPPADAKIVEVLAAGFNAELGLHIYSADEEGTRQSLEAARRYRPEKLQHLLRELAALIEPAKEAVGGQ